MRNEHIKDLSKILFLDIETVPAVPNFSELDERTAKLFGDKTRFEQERSGKTAEEVYGDRAGIFPSSGRSSASASAD